MFTSKDTKTELILGSKSLTDSRRAERIAGFLTRYLKFADKNVRAPFEGDLVLCRYFG